MSRQIGFTRRTSEILEDYYIFFDHMPSGIDNTSITMRSNQIEDKENEVLSAIRKRCDIDELSISHDLAILMIVGEGMTRSVGTINTITRALVESNIDLKMIDQGASEISMMFDISRENADKVVLSTYEYCYHGVCLENLYPK